MANDNPLILAVETSGRLGSVALAQGPKLLAEKQFTGPMRHSAEIFPAIVELLKQFDKKPNQIEQVYISVGPGSFTGLRIAVALAKSFALANQAKIVAVDTLDCIAANVIKPTAENAPWNSENSRDKVLGIPRAGTVPRGFQRAETAEKKKLLPSDERLAAILDAKRGQFFVAVYEKASSGWEKILPDSLLTADEFLERFSDKPIALIGEGLVFYKDRFVNSNIRVLDEKFWNPSAANVYKLGRQKALLNDFADLLTLAPNYIRGPDVKTKQM